MTGKETKELLIQALRADYWLLQEPEDVEQAFAEALAALDGCVLLTAEEQMRVRGHLFWCASKAEVEDSLESCDCLALLAPKEASDE